MATIDESYLGNPLLKKANTDIEFTPEQVLEFGRCIQDPVYFSENYIKIVTIDKGLQPFKMYDFQRKMLRSLHDNRFNICKLPRQCGKMLALDTYIPTPDGWTTIEKIEVGDTIFGKDGKQTKVIAKSPIQFIDSYEIEFETGEKIKCCGEHQWEICHIGWKGRKRVVTTNELIRLRKKIRCLAPFYVDVCESIEIEDKNLPIDPYTLGIFIANGYLSDAMIFGKPDYLDDIIKNIKYPVTKKVNRRNSNIWEYYFETFTRELRDLGLTDNNRRIPMNYFRASTKQRVELLRGIMDAKGVVDKDIVCKFRSDDEMFIDEVKHLLSSLGIKYRTRYINAHLFGRKKIELLFTTCKYSLFKKYEKLRKQTLCSTHEKNYKLFIHKIRKIPTEPMQCISVDNDDHLFLCSKSFVPTHNSTTVVSYLLHFAIFNENVNVAILANKLSTARDLLGKLQTAYENLPKWLQQGVLSWNKGSLELENGSKIHAASTSASSVRGGTYNIIFLDEFAFVQNSVADQFFSSVYPTITSGNSSKVIIVSTPKGMNHFYKLWVGAVRRENNYITTEVHWRDIPGRDDKFKEETIKNTSLNQWKAEFESILFESQVEIMNGQEINTIEIGQLYDSMVEYKSN